MNTVAFEILETGTNNRSRREHRRFAPNGGRNIPAFFAALTLLTTAANAQSPSAPSSKPAAASPSAAPRKNVTFTLTRPGSYQLFIPGSGGIGAFSQGDHPTVATGVDNAATEADVIDKTSGTVAVIPAAKLKNGAKIEVAPGDFKYVSAVAVAVTASGKPVAEGSVTLADADGKAHAHRLTAADSGIARFENVPLGKATVTVSYAADGPKATQETVIAPAKGGADVEIPVALTGSVPTLDKPPAAMSAASGAPILPAPAAPAPEPPANNWIPGVVGLMLLAAGGFYGFRHLKNRGMTVEGALRKIGVEMPQDAQATAIGPLKPAAPVLPPLPALSDLPAAGPSPVRAGGGGVATAVRAAVSPQLVGIGGNISGEVFVLSGGTPFTIGRDADNSLALTQDMGLSRRHARFERQPDGWAVVDEGSSNGTFVNGQRVTGRQSLRAGDEIQAGGARFRFEG